MKLSRPSGRSLRFRCVVPSAPAKPSPVPLRAVPGVRSSRIATAQARIASDYYDRDDVRERLVEALLRELKER